MEFRQPGQLLYYSLEKSPICANQTAKMVQSTQWVPQRLETDFSLPDRWRREQVTRSQWSHHNPAALPSCPTWGGWSHSPGATTWSPWRWPPIQPHLPQTPAPPPAWISPTGEWACLTSSQELQFFVNMRVLWNTLKLLDGMCSRLVKGVRWHPRCC